MSIDYEAIGEAIGKSQKQAVEQTLLVVRKDIDELVDAIDGVMELIKADPVNKALGVFENRIAVQAEQIQVMTDQIRSHEIFEAQLTARLEEIKDGEDGERGPAGLDGRDGLDRPLVEPVDISVDKQYPKNTLGTYNGGLWIATKEAIGNPESDPIGWSCLLDSMTTMSVDLMPDRTFKLSVRMATGKLIEDTFKIPFCEHKGIWEEGSYEAGDIVTKGHSFWQAMEDTSGEPPGNGWKQILTAPRGKQGEPGKSIEGPQGKPGRNGLDAKLPKNFIEDVISLASERKAFEDGRTGAEAITSFRGYFMPSESYRSGDVINHDGSLYLCNRSGSYASIGASDGAFDLMMGVPKSVSIPFMLWKGQWIDGQTYNPGFTVRDGSWTMVANKTTNDRAAPYPVGPDVYPYSGTMSPWENTAKVILYGQRYLTANPLFLTGYKLDVIADNLYEIFWVEDSLNDPKPKLLSSFVPTSSGLVENVINPIIVTAGKSIDILVQLTEPDPTPTQWTGDWFYNTPNNDGIPTAGTVLHANTSPQSFRISTLDNVGGDRYAELAALTPGDRIARGSFVWTISAIADNTTWFNFIVLPALQDASDGLATLTFDTVTPTPITIGRDVGYWTGSPFSVNGLISVDSDYANITVDENAYGIIDLHWREAYVSEDWDVVSIGSVGGSA